MSSNHAPWDFPIVFSGISSFGRHCYYEHFDDIIFDKCISKQITFIYPIPGSFEGTIKMLYYYFVTGVPKILDSNGWTDPLCPVLHYLQWSALQLVFVLYSRILSARKKFIMWNLLMYTCVYMLKHMEWLLSSVVTFESGDKTRYEKG